MTQPYKYVYVDSGLFYWPGREKEYTSPEETYKEAVLSGNTNILVFEKNEVLQKMLAHMPPSFMTRFYIISLILSSNSTEIEKAFVHGYSISGKLIVEVDYMDGRTIDVECITTEKIGNVIVNYWRPYPFHSKEMTLLELDELINEYA